MFRTSSFRVTARAFAIRRGAATFAAVALAVTLLSSLQGVRGADHGDTALLRSIQRHDARLTDLYAFIRDDNLVLAVCLDPTVPPGTTEYQFPQDLAIRISIDTHSEVSFDDPDDLAVFGGTIVEPGSISEDIVFEITFEKRGIPALRIAGMPGRVRKEVEFFAGLRDDPFIRGPRIGRNVAALVVQLPAEHVVEPHGTLLVWAKSKVPDVRGPRADLAGGALRNQFPENEPMNLLHPKDHSEVLGVPPDVLIFDTSRRAAFPNGRELTDDVVDNRSSPHNLCGRGTNTATSKPSRSVA